MIKTRPDRAWLDALPLLAMLTFSPLAFAAGAPSIGQDIAYASGGIGTDERDEMLAMLGDYSLKLAFAFEGSGAYVGEVSVTLNRAGEPVFQVDDVGPWLLVKLPAGPYEVVVESAGQTVEAMVRVPQDGYTEAVLRFPPE